MTFRRSALEEVSTSLMSCQMEIPEDILSQVRQNIQLKDGQAMVLASMWKELDKQRKENQFCDAQIQCAQDVTIPVHKCVLAVVSPYFKTLFTSLLCHHTVNQQIIDLKDYSKEAITVLLDYVYTGEADLDSVELVELLKLAEFLQYGLLVKHLIKGIHRTMSADTWLLWFSVGLECGVADLTTLSIRYMILHGLPLTDGLIPEMLEKIVHLRNQIAVKKMNFYHSTGQIYSVDTAQKIVKEHEIRFHYQMSKKKLRILSFFVMKGNLYIAGTHPTDDSPSELRFSLNHIEIQIYSYDIGTQTYRLVEYRDMAYMLSSEVGFTHAEVDRHVETHGYFDVKQLTFDGLNHLFILIGNDVQHFVAKFDLDKGFVSRDYLWFDIPTNAGFLQPVLESIFVESKHKGTLLVRGIEHMYDVERFDFTTRFDSKVKPQHLKRNKAEKLPTELKLCRNYSSSDTPATEEATVPAENCNLLACKVLSVNGEIYSFVVFVEKISRVVALHFDTEQLTWIEVCCFSIDNHELSNAFTCSGKCYVVLSLEMNQQKNGVNGNLIHSGGALTDEVHEVVYEFDVDRKNFSRLTGMCMPPNGKRFMCSEVPEYYLV